MPAGASMVYNFLIPRPATPVIPGVTVHEVDAAPRLAGHSDDSGALKGDELPRGPSGHE